MPLAFADAARAIVMPSALKGDARATDSHLPGTGGGEVTCLADMDSLEANVEARTAESDRLDELGHSV